MKGARWNAEDVAAGVEANNMVGIIPAEIHQIKGAPTLQGQQIVLLMGMQIELPGAGLLLIGGLTAGPEWITRSRAFELATVISKKRTAGVSRNFS